MVKPESLQCGSALGGEEKTTLPKKECNTVLLFLKHITVDNLLKPSFVKVSDLKISVDQNFLYRKSKPPY